MTKSTPFRGRDSLKVELKQAERLQAVQRHAPRYLPTFRRAYSGLSLRAAVNAICVECVGFDAAAVKDCTAPACPLWANRPGRSKAVPHA